MRAKMYVFRNLSTVCYLREKSDASAVKSYIKIQAPIDHTSMAPNYAIVKIPQTDVAQAFIAELQEFLHDYVINCATEPHEFYTPEMSRDDIARVSAFDHCELGVVLFLMGGDSEKSIRDPTEISRFKVMNVPVSLLDYIIGVQKTENETFRTIVGLPVQIIARQDTWEQWEQRQAKWQQYHERAEVGESRFHTHLKESTNFLRKLKEFVDE